MAVAYSWNKFPLKSANVAASRLSHVKLRKGFAGSSMKRARLRLFHWTFLLWHKIVLQTAVNRRVCGHRQQVMRLHVDKEADALYLRLDDSKIIESEEVAPGVIQSDAEFEDDSAEIPVGVGSASKRAGRNHPLSPTSFRVMDGAQRHGYSQNHSDAPAVTARDGVRRSDVVRGW